MSPSRRARPSSRINRVVDLLTARYGKLDPPARVAFELVIWEKVAYLTTDDRRRAAFERFEKRVGLTAESVAAAKRATIIDVLESGGIGAPERANNLIEAAQFVVGELDGRLDIACALPLPHALRQLKRIRGIADPGAEKILLFTKTHPVLGLESNGLRVLTRLGYGQEAKSYASTYKSATSAALPELGTDIERLTQTNLVLRQHGLTICKTSAPKCGACVVRELCPSAPPDRLSEPGPRAPKTPAARRERSR